MKRGLGVTRLGPEDQSPLIITTGPQITQQQSVSVNLHPQPSSGAIHESSSQQSQNIVNIVSSQPMLNYAKPGNAHQYGGVQYSSVPPKPPAPAPPHHQPRHKNVVGNQSPGNTISANSVVNMGAALAAGTQFQRLKVEDALSYLDQVKFKFNTQPQVYNDFLDIMKEFKSQSIDTPGVIARVSNLFKGHPELIVGFNTFLPPGYKIEVQSNDQGYAYQVSVSVPSPNSLQHTSGHNNITHTGPPIISSAAGLIVAPPQSVQQSSQQHSQHLVQIIPGSTAGAIVQTLSASATAPQSMSAVAAPPTVVTPAAPTNTLHHISQAHQQLEAPAPPPNNTSQPVEFNHAIEYVNKIKNRFNRQPEKYKKFLEILHAYQRGQKEPKEQQVKQQNEQEVYAQVAKLFENQDDLLMEFGQFLPDATGGCGIGSATIKSASSVLDAVRPPDSISSRPRSTPQIPPARVTGDSMVADTEPSYHSINARATSPGYGSSGNIVPSSSAQTSLTSHRVESSHSQSITTSNQHPSSQLSSHHHLKHSSSSHHVSSSLSSTHHLKRSPSFSTSNQLSAGAPPPKKHKLLYTPRDVSYAEAAKHASLKDFEFFDRVRKALRSQEVYENFLRCLLLFVKEIVSKSELMVITTPFFTRYPELQRWLQDFLGPTTGASGSPSPARPTSPIGSAPLGNGAIQPLLHPYSSLSQSYGGYSVGGERYTGEPEPLPPLAAHLRQDRPQGDAALEIDLTTCKRLGTSYCALPRQSSDAASRRCSGRTALCRDVLNDVWVSFPTWAEDSTFVTSRKTQYEEYIYRCEDERFELDVVIETNASTILALEGVHKKLSRMSTDEASRYRLDDCLGGSSPTIHQKALKRIYGEKAPDIIAGLKKNPAVAVPVVLRRLKSKEEEWREAQKGFNKQWKELNEKFYLKSLDHQGLNFKQNDLKALRSKSLFNEIETIHEERRDQMQSALNSSCAGIKGPHLSAKCGGGGSSLLADAADLLIHHVRRQTAVQKQEKQKIKQLLRHFLPDLFCHPRMALSDDERDDDDKELDVSLDSPGSTADETKTGGDSPDRDAAEEEKKQEEKSSIKQERDASSESDSNAPEKPNGGRPSRTEKSNSSSSNKENLKSASVSRNNSADSDGKDNAPSSKLSDSGSNKGSTSSSVRRRDTSTDSMNVIKSEDYESHVVPAATDISISNLPPLYDPKDIKDKNPQPVVFYGSGHWYVFLRLHAVLCQRLANMKALAAKLAAEEAGDAKLRKPATAVALKLKPDNTLPVSQYYSALLEMVRSVLDGNTEASAYEDGLREMFGIHAYIAFTLDKVVSYAVRQLQQCVQERVATRCVDIHMQERTRGTMMSSSYQHRIEKILKDEHAFKMCIYGGEECKVTFELLDPRGDDGCSSPPQPPIKPARISEWERYRERFANPSQLPDLPEGIYKDGKWCGRKPLFLSRNIRNYRRKHPESEKQQTRPKVSNPGSSEDDDDGPPVHKRTKKDTEEKTESSAVSNFVNDDRSECKIDPESYKLLLVYNRDHLMYKGGSVLRAKKSHKSVTQRKYNKWVSWHKAWRLRQVNSRSSIVTTEWLQRGTRMVTAGSSERAPYRTYTRYRLDSAGR